jgi:DNA-binding response OmpR family regulator
LLFLVEDEELVLMTIEAALEDAGYTVRAARTGEEALTVLDSEGQQFQALITDVNLGPIDGWAVARHARELNAQMPVIYVTGDSAHLWASQGVPKSVLIEKPFAPAQLVTAVSSLLIITDVASVS